MGKTILSKTFGKYKMRHTVTPISRLAKYIEPNVLPMVGDPRGRTAQQTTRLIYQHMLAASRIDHPVAGQAAQMDPGKPPA